MNEINRQWLLRRRPTGISTLADFEYTESSAAHRSLAPGEVLLRNRYFLCAPTMRNWMDPPSNSLYPSIPLGMPVMAPTAGEVIASARAGVAAGDRVMTFTAWEDVSVVTASQTLTPIHADLSYVEAMGPYGLNALTGYFGLLKVGLPQIGETLVVSGAAGSAGSAAAQIGKIKGCRVIGIAGGLEKCDWLIRTCGLDATIDYKSESLPERLAQLCPHGIDIFFDNVGGAVLQAAVENIARFGRIVLCGQIAGYNDSRPTPGPRNMMRLIYGSVKMQGFLTGDYALEHDSAIEELRGWVRNRQFSHREDVRTGFMKIPETFAALFDGTNKGTLLAAIE